MSEASSAGEPVEALRAADERYRERQTAVEAVGADRLETAAEAYRDLTTLLDRYEEPATGTGDFEQFIHFQGEVATLVEELPEDVPERDAFEAVSERLHERQLRHAHFERAREDLAPVADLVERLTARDEARERYRAARRAVTDRRDELAERVAALEDLVAYEDAPLDAPVEDLRDPIEAYDDAVTAAFDAFRAETPAVDVLEWADVVGRRFPLVGVEAPRPELLAFLRETPAGEETVPTLLEYAEFSRSKLDHYVADPGRFRAVVGADRTYLAALSAAPLTIAWPPPPADVLRFRCDALVRAVGRFADEATVARCRAVRALTRRADYPDLRRAADARESLDADAVERVRSGAAREDLRAAREALERHRAALAEHPER